MQPHPRRVMMNGSRISLRLPGMRPSYICIVRFPTASAASLTASDNVGCGWQVRAMSSAAPPNSAGWDIVLIGKATDMSGFGGAAFSSVTLDEADAEANKGAVQVPDPFLKNVIMRARRLAAPTSRVSSTRFARQTGSSNSSESSIAGSSIFLPDVKTTP